MLPIINGKSLMECEESDFRVLISNPDFRENDHIDYKASFSMLNKNEKKEKRDVIAEFRSDVCSFANADGGYLVYGIEEDGEGVPKDIVGVDLDVYNPDKLELNIKTWLQTIEPRIPNVKVHFIKLNSGRYIVVLYIKRDMFAPYIHLEDEKNYRIYKRYGNSKQSIKYGELRALFNQSVDMDSMIEKYRSDRIVTMVDKKRTDESRFVLFHVIPEHFLDSSYNKPFYLVVKRNGQMFVSLFQAIVGTSCHFEPIPNGVRCVSNNDRLKMNEIDVYNNGIAESVIDISQHLKNSSNDEYPFGVIPTSMIKDRIQKLIQAYLEIMQRFIEFDSCYLCFTLVGCEGASSYDDPSEPYGYSYVDSNILKCPLVYLSDCRDEKQTEIDIKRFVLDMAYSLGIRTGATIYGLEKEVYPDGSI